MAKPNDSRLPDEAALAILLDTSLSPARRDAQLRTLAKEVRGRLEGRLPCPECGDEGPHDDNGDRQDPAYSCRACGSYFEPEEA